MGDRLRGGGFDGDCVAEGFEFADESSLAGIGAVDAAGEVIRAEVAVGGGLGEHMPDDHCGTCLPVSGAHEHSGTERAPHTGGLHMSDPQPRPAASPNAATASPVSASTSTRLDTSLARRPRRGLRFTSCRTTRTGRYWPTQRSASPPQRPTSRPSPATQIISRGTCS